MIDYYKVLGVKNDASMLEIKKAYFKQVRLFPPEKEEAKFKEIREAYENLIDDAKRNHYDMLSKLPDSMREAFQVGLQAMKDGDEKYAIRIFKEIEEEFGNADFITDLLGEAFLGNGNTNNAIKKFKELCDRHPGNLKYMLKLGTAYRKRNFNKKAEKLIRECIDMDKTNPIPWNELIILYLENPRYRDLGLNIIDKALIICDKKSPGFANLFEHYFYYDVSTQNYHLIDEHLAKVKKILIDHHELVKDAVNSLADLTSLLLDPVVYRFAQKMADLILEFNPDDDFIQDLHKFVCEKVSCFILMEKLKANSRINSEIYGYLFFTMLVDISKYNKDPELHMKAICEKTLLLSKLMTNLKYLKKDLKELKKHFYPLYLMEEKFFDSILAGNVKIDSDQKIMMEMAKMMEKFKALDGIFDPNAELYDDDNFDFAAYDDDDDNDDECEDQCEKCIHKFECIESDYYNTEKQEPVRVEKVGRNDPCPCGSGKKYKKCCLDK